VVGDQSHLVAVGTCDWDALLPQTGAGGGGLGAEKGMPFLGVVSDHLEDPEH